MSDRSRGTEPMRAVRYDRYGTSDVLDLRTVPVPEPGRDDVLVRVHASGLNPKDPMIRSGALRLQTGRTFPRGTGFDFAGEVAATGAGIADLAPGTAVWGFLDGTLGGTAGDYVRVPRRWLAPLPEGVGWLEAAALPLVGSAALQALQRVGRLRAGERVLIKGANGGVGSAAIQIARAMGAHVTALAKGDAIEYCRARGAHEVLDAQAQPLSLPPEPFDLFLDCAGHSPLVLYGRHLTRRGRWVTVAPSLPVYALSLVSRLLAPLLGTPRFGFIVVRPSAADLEALGSLVSGGSLRAPVFATYALDEIRAAHDAVQAGGSLGKRVLVVSPEAAREAAEGATPRRARPVRASVGIGGNGRPARPDLAKHEAAGVLHAEVAAGRSPAVRYQHFTKDSVLFRYNEGLADTASRRTVSERTTFNGFSVTKTATAVAILQLVDRGLVELDAPAATYLPDFPYGETITVRQLLSHAAGLPNPLPLNWIHPEAEHAAFQPRPFFEMVFARNRRTAARPGTRMKYSNLGYVLLGQIIEDVTGLSYEAYIGENVLAPIGLAPRDLGFAMDPQRHATGYHRRWSVSRLLLRFTIDQATYLEPGRGRWQAFRRYYVNGAAYGGLIGTAEGFTRYLQALLDPASGLLSERSRRALFTEHVLKEGIPSGMALSWFRGELDGHVYYAHAGGGGGFYAEIRIYPELARGSVVLFNRTGFSDARFLDRVDRHLLAGAPASGTSQKVFRWRSLRGHLPHQRPTQAQGQVPL